MTRRLRPFCALLLLLALLGQSAWVFARVNLDASPQDSLTRLVQFDLCGQGQIQPDTPLLPCDQCLTHCCAAFLTPDAPQLARLNTTPYFFVFPSLSASQAFPPSWQRPPGRAPPHSS